jgi:hypothetical protein
MNHAPARLVLRGVLRVARPGAGLLARAATSLCTPALAGALIVGLATWLGAGLASLISTPAHAQARMAAPARTVLADPTRPPPAAAALLLAPPALPGAAPAGGPPHPAANPAATLPASLPPPAPPQLQGLRLAHDGTPASALIDAQLLQTGERLRDWTILAIRADGVLLGRPAPAQRRTTPTGPGPAAHGATATAFSPSAASASAPASPSHTLWLALLPPLAAPAPTRP